MKTSKNTNLLKLTSKEIRILEEWRDYIIDRITLKYSSPIRISDGNKSNWKWEPSLLLFQKLLDRSTE